MTFYSRRKTKYLQVQWQRWQINKAQFLGLIRWLVCTIHMLQYVLLEGHVCLPCMYFTLQGWKLVRWDARNASALIFLTEFVAKQSETIYCVNWHTTGTVDVHALNTIMPFHAKESSFHVWSKEKEQPLTKWHSAQFEGFWSGKEGSCRPAGYQAEAISPRSASCYGTCIKNPDTSAFLMFT